MLGISSGLLVSVWFPGSRQQQEERENSRLKSFGFCWVCLNAILCLWFSSSLSFASCKQGGCCESHHGLCLQDRTKYGNRGRLSKGHCARRDVMGTGPRAVCRGWCLLLWGWELTQSIKPLEASAGNAFIGWIFSSLLSQMKAFLVS